MAKSKWWSHGRKPSTSSGENETVGTVTPDSEGHELGNKSPSRFMRTLTGLRRSRSKKDKTRRRGSHAHLDRPFTQENLEHQKILNAFAFSFGKRRKSHGAQSSVSGISPSASRNTSVDDGACPLSAARSHSHSHGDRRDTHPRFGSSLARDAPQEVPGEESDQERRGPVQALPDAPQVARRATNHS